MLSIGSVMSGGVNLVEEGEVEGCEVLERGMAGSGEVEEEEEEVAELMEVGGEVTGDVLTDFAGVGDFQCETVDELADLLDEEELKVRSQVY